MHGCHETGSWKTSGLHFFYFLGGGGGEEKMVSVGLKNGRCLIEIVNWLGEQPPEGRKFLAGLKRYGRLELRHFRTS